MKKILIGVLIILLCFLAYFAIFNGISLGSFHILSVGEIKDENDRLVEDISEIEKARETDYPSKTEQLKEETEKLMDEKATYLDLASISTESELKEANQEETYLIEYLWIRVGNHAKNEGVILKMEPTSGDTGESNVKNLNFTATGYYIPITNFISSIENDSRLGFRIENFKMVPADGSGSILTATFTVRNVRIKEENITSNTSANINSTDSNATNSQTNNTVNNTTNNTTNTESTNTNTTTNTQS